MGWAVSRHAEGAAAFHARTVAEPAGRAVWVCDPTAPALVLGSAQPDAVADPAACERAGVALVRRRSGGGAVLVEPGALLWLDVVVPAGDPLWDPDVGRSFLWLGEAWARALAALGVAAQVHGGALERTRWSDLVCFAGLGTGEVTDLGGAKLVGLSQRRTRAAARFQCAALLGWEPDRLVSLLALDGPSRAAAAADLGLVAAGIPAAPDALLASLLDQLP